MMVVGEVVTVGGVAVVLVIKDVVVMLLLLLETTGTSVNSVSTSVSACTRVCALEYTSPGVLPEDGGERVARLLRPRE
jgi:hypothetical protein